MIKMIFIFLAMIANPLFASIRPLGHNVSQTDYLPEKTCSIGSQAVFCSNGQLGIGSAPFLFFGYNMASAFIKARIREDAISSHSLQAAYFKTIVQEPITISDDYGEFEWTPGYKQEAQWLTYIYSRQISAVYRFHFNLSVQHYSLDRQPFSIRRPTIKRDPYQLNMTTLHEVKISENFGMIGELGLIHVNDIYPRLHTGASVGYMGDNLLVQFGFSMTGTYEAMFEGRAFRRNDYQAELQSYENGYEEDLDPEKIRYDFSLHPEIVIQFQF